MRVSGSVSIAAIVGAAVWAAACGGTLRAWAGEPYELVLHQGGRVVGELLNPDELPRRTYHIRTHKGVEVVLEASEVAERRHIRPEKLEYERIKPRFPDTVEGQWALAEWCAEHHLYAERRHHLERILELDENHQQARRALGYGRIDGQWKTQEQVMKEQGYVWYQGAWRTPQEVKIRQEERKREEAEAEWNRRIALWRRWLDSERAPAAVQNIRAIRDPHAAKALAKALQEETNPQRRILFVEALGRIGTPAAMAVLARWTLTDSVEEVSLTCLDYLKAANDYAAVAYFVSQLKSKDNNRINRAAVALRHMGNPAAIPALIDALITTHRQTVTIGGPGRMAPSFSKGGASPGGLTLGSKTIVLTHRVQNRAVLEALVELSGGKNFGFDPAAWKSWYISTQRPYRLDVRRG